MDPYIHQQGYNNMQPQGVQPNLGSYPQQQPGGAMQNGPLQGSYPPQQQNYSQQNYGAQQYPQQGGFSHQQPQHTSASGLAQVSGLLHTLQGKPSGGAHQGAHASHSSGKVALGKKVFKEGQKYLNKYQQGQKPPGQQAPGQPIGAYGGQHGGVQQGAPGAGPQSGAPPGYPL